MMKSDMGGPHDKPVLRGLFASLIRGRRRFVSTRTIIIINIFVLLVNTYVLVMQVQHNGYLSSESYFKSPLTSAQEDDFRSILKLFVSTMERANVTYMLTFGTLLGSLRHHGKIPWDDDIDIAIYRGHRNRMERALKRLESKYKLYRYLEWPSLGKWKFYRKTSSAFLLFPYANYRWPYIDIFFFESFNATHEKHSYYNNLYYPKKSMYPLRRRPYEGMMLPAPCNPWEIIRSEFYDPYFDPHVCQSRSFSHVMELPIPIWRQRSVPCSRLEKEFPFVYTSKLDTNSTKETLKIDSKVLHSVVLPFSECTGVPNDMYRKHSMEKGFD